MLRSLFTGISGLTNSQERMDVIGNNLANVNTVGFKASRVSFADSISQTLKASSPAGANSAGDSAMQVGTGVSTSGISTMYTTGAVTRTGVNTDLALVGEGYFVVKDTVTAQSFATRAGDFRVDSNGYLVTSSGLRVQGFTDNTFGTVGDVKVAVPPGTAAGTTVDSYAFGSDGKIVVRLSDGTQGNSGQVLLQKFNDTQALMKVGNSLYDYSAVPASGKLTWTTGSTSPGIPNQAGLGRVESNSLELSNVDMATEFTNMITTQRAYQASARVISTSDELLQELVNLKR